jgi:hypothetical protein
MLVRAHDGRVDHQPFEVGLRGERLQKGVERAALDSAIVAALHRLMIAEAFGPIAPAAAPSGPSTTARRRSAGCRSGPALTGSAAGHKILQPLQLIVAQRIHIPNHQSRSPKISLESRKSAGENPLTLKSLEHVPKS